MGTNRGNPPKEDKARLCVVLRSVWLQRMGKDGMRDILGSGSGAVNERKGVGGYSIYVYLSMMTEECSEPCLNEACILRVSVYNPNRSSDGPEKLKV